MTNSEKLQRATALYQRATLLNASGPGSIIGVQRHGESIASFDARMTRETKERGRTYLSTVAEADLLMAETTATPNAEPSADGGKDAGQ